MDKEVVAYIHSGILLSHKKEHIWVSFNEVDEPRVYYIEWSKLEREKDHILKHIYGIEKNGTDEPICRLVMEIET